MIKIVEEKMINKIEKSIKEFFDIKNLRELAGLLLIVFVVRSFVFGLYQVPSPSMETTMCVNERFLAEKFTYLFTDPKRGDILSMNDPTYEYSDNYFKRIFEEYVWGPSNWTKRVVGIPGDTLEGRVENGRPVVYLNGEKLDEPQVNKYPIMHVWKSDKDIIKRAIDTQVARAMRFKAITPKDARDYTQQLLMQKGLDWVSFDPEKAWDKQPFYCVKPSRIYHDPKTGEKDILHPGTPLYGINSFKIPEGKNFWNRTDYFYVKLGADEYWCMGDNRLASADSRFFGPVKRRLIHGRIVWCIWSIDSDDSWWIIDLIKHPINFWQRIRWSRCMKKIY